MDEQSPGTHMMGESVPSPVGGDGVTSLDATLPPVEAQPPRRKRRWLATTWPFVRVALVLFVFFVGWFVNNYTFAYYAESPSKPRDVTKLVSVPDDLRHEPQGTLFLTTVKFQKVTPMVAFRAWWDGDYEITKQKDILGTTSDAEYERQNVQMMSDSKRRATYLALKRLGYTIKEDGDGTYVLGVQPNGPSAAKLHAGDVITGIDGVDTHDILELRAAIRSHKPGDSMVLSLLEDANVNQPERTETVTAIGDTDGNAVIGIYPQTYNQRFTFPVNVKIDDEGIGGPSAGLAFTLAILDELTPGELTGGKNIAVTGEINEFGAVGPIGGIKQKALAVKRAHADAFIVPTDNVDEAKKEVGDALNVIGVATLEDALKALQTLGGNSAELPAAPDRLYP